MGRLAVVALLVLIAVGAALAASSGLGAAWLDERPEVRSGSVGGPAVVGRGPRMGK